MSLQYQPILKEDWKSFGKASRFQMLADFLNSVAKMLNSLSVAGTGGWFDKSEDSISLILDSSSGGAKSLSVVRSSTQTYVTVRAGYAYHGTNAPAAVSETEVEVTGGTSASPHYVVFSYNYSTKAATILTTASSALPQPTTTHWLCALREVYRDGAEARLGRIFRECDIYIPVLG